MRHTSARMEGAGRWSAFVCALLLLLAAAGGTWALPAGPSDDSLDSALPPEPSQALAPLEIRSVELRPENAGVQLQVSTSGPLVWTSYRDAAGNLVVELPNSVPIAQLADLDLQQGMVESARIHVEENGERPLTRLVVRTTGPAEHSVEADGGTLLVDLLPVAVPPLVDVKTANLAVAEEPLAPESLYQGASPLPDFDATAQGGGTPDQPQAGPPPTGVPATQLQAVEVSSEGQATIVWIIGDGEFYYSTFGLENPDRFVVDLNGVVKTAPLSTVPVGAGVVERVRVAQFKSRPDLVSRVVVDLRDAAAPEIEPTSEGLRITFRPRGAAADLPAVAQAQPEPLETAEGSAEIAAAVPAMEPEPMPMPVEPMAAELEPARPEPMPEPMAAPIEAQGEPEVLEPELVEVGTAESAPQPLTTTAEPVYEEPPPAKPVAPSPPARVPAMPPQAIAEPQLKASFAATDVAAATAPEATPPAGFERSPVVGASQQWRGEPMTMTLKDADIKDVLRSFAQISGLNIVVQPGVAGTVTVELNKVPWDQALAQILKINNLGYQLEGNIMRIAPITVLRTEAEEEQRLLQAQALSIPLKTIIRRISYASAEDIASVLSSGGGASILSQRGSVIVDSRTNTVIIKELPSVINTVIAVIESLDIPEPQVTIEARIIETTKRFTRTLGVQWDFNALADAVHGNTTGLVFPNNVDVAGGVNLLTGARNGFLDISLGNVLNTFRLDAVLQAAENEGLINILSAPKITTLNNERATIQSGLQIPIQTIANNTVSVQFINATLRLDVTPHVTASGTVLMDIDIQKREPQLAFAVAGAQNAPIATKDARTRVIVRDGGTSVIGGIYEVTSDQGEDRVPGLANIPILKHLFRNKRRTDENEELLIFITPRVVKL